MSGFDVEEVRTGPTPFGRDLAQQLDNEQHRKDMEDYLFRQSAEYKFKERQRQNLNSPDPVRRRIARWVINGLPT
jgi:hypothetical protein